ncbi:MAG: HAD family hydrolase [Dehalococcoidia bacterium]|nr:HAD family hydrolase [Dehalococcoidia bacterium]
MKLVVFDLDHTLVDLIAIHDEVTDELFREEYGVHARLTEIDYSGRSMTENLIQVARLKNISPERLGDSAGLLQKYEKKFSRKLPVRAGEYILSGVEKLLGAVARKGHLLALYTGDSPGIVQAVFKNTGLGKHFRIAVCGTQAETRDGLLRLAIGQAESIAGGQFTDSDVVVVGDSVRDIEAGRKVNARTIAVVTGFHSEEALREAGPDCLFKDLQDCDAVLGAIEGKPCNR